jgi:hypothetical protein
MAQLYRCMVDRRGYRVSLGQEPEHDLERHSLSKSAAEAR